MNKGYNYIHSKFEMTSILAQGQGYFLRKGDYGWLLIKKLPFGDQEKIEYSHHSLGVIKNWLEENEND